MTKYNFNTIENKWRKKWLQEKTFKTTEDSSKPFFYALDMFPYPSGTGLHVGHPAGYTASDIIARYKKMKGFNVLHAIGWDAFGLPAEQYAITTGNHPAEFTLKNIDIFREQLQLLGYSYDWDKEINTSDPEFYKWTQWIFQQFIKHNYAELRKVPVNWCEELSTVLANDEIVTDDKGNQISERGGFKVIQKPMTQWVIKSKEFADKLIAGLEKLDWIESTKIMQKNFIQDAQTGEILLRDWTFSRQRYWGEPFPVKHKKDKTIELVPEDQLPLVLPMLNNFEGKNGKPALANSKEWLEKGYDLNTMPGSAGSSWYHLAYILKDENGYLPLNSKEAKEKIKKWLPVDLYIGGTEHTTGHLIYARIWNMFLAEIGVIDHPEPFQKLIHQGMVLGPDGKKMSKSKGNVINPNDVIKKYGADTLRTYIVFMGAFEDVKPWSDSGLAAIFKWINRVWTTITTTPIVEKSSIELEVAYAKLISGIEKSFENNKFNIAVSNLMVFINVVIAQKQITKNQIKGFIQALSPIAPHICEELWELKGCETKLSTTPWPTFDPELLIEKTFEMAIVINGKFKTTLEVQKGLSQDEILDLVKSNEKTAKLLKDHKKTLYVPDKLLNIIK